ncbi:hypothetical protein J5690_08835, partial [bacterium]|nr:hypothetical protein [bacterium]
MKKLLLLCAVFALAFMLGCGGGHKETPKTDGDQTEISDGDTDDSGDSDDDLDSNDLDISDLDISDDDSDNPQEPEDHDIPETPDETPDSDIPVNPEATENHKISGVLQAGSAVSGIKAALYDCGGTEELASADTGSDGKFSFKADISAAKTY